MNVNTATMENTYIQEITYTFKRRVERTVARGGSRIFERGGGPSYVYKPKGGGGSGGGSTLGPKLKSLQRGPKGGGSGPPWTPWIRPWSQWGWGAGEGVGMETGMDRLMF